jgi:hypothetical protein
MRVALSYIEKIYGQFLVFKDYRLYDINFTGQTMYLQKKLRDTFACQGILIEDGQMFLPVYLHNQSEQQLPLYLFNEFENETISYLNNSTELSSQNDFVVKVPASCYNSMDTHSFHKMRTILEFYKMAQKTYSIISY